ncbi:MAG: DUF1289 domain-containing protein [Hyphomicrobium sp.]|nr:DUF1289 domain-containing protein [Hyphomicrobium sp.]
MDSPCIKICEIDEGRGLCLGCGRTRAEIARWTSYSDSERRTIMTTLAQRLADSGALLAASTPSDITN